MGKVPLHTEHVALSSFCATCLPALKKLAVAVTIFPLLVLSPNTANFLDIIFSSKLAKDNYSLLLLGRCNNPRFTARRKLKC